MFSCVYVNDDSSSNRLITTIILDAYQVCYNGTQKPMVNTIRIKIFQFLFVQKVSVKAFFSKLQKSYMVVSEDIFRGVFRI